MRLGDGAYKFENASKTEIVNEEELFLKSVRLPEKEERHVTRVVASCH